MDNQLVSAPDSTHRQKVDRLEAEVSALPQVLCPVRNHFAPGVYAREITIPAGATVVGAVHKLENLAVLSQGTMLIATPDGPQELSAPAIVRILPGAKNAVTALTECVFTNFFATTETDLDKLVPMLVEAEASDLLGGDTNKQLAASGMAALEN